MLRVVERDSEGTDEQKSRDSTFVSFQFFIGFYVTADYVTYLIWPPQLDVAINHLYIAQEENKTQTLSSDN